MRIIRLFATLYKITFIMYLFIDIEIQTVYELLAVVWPISKSITGLLNIFELK